MSEGRIIHNWAKNIKIIVLAVMVAIVAQAFFNSNSAYARTDFENQSMPSLERIQQLARRQAADSIWAIDGSTWIGKLDGGVESVFDANVPRGLVVDSNNTAWTMRYSKGQISQYGGDGELNSYNIPGGPTADPTSTNTQYLAIANDSTIWFTQPDTDKVTRMTSAGVMTQYSLPAGSKPEAIVNGADGNLWVTLAGTKEVARVSPSGQITRFALNNTWSLAPQIVDGPGGVWVVMTEVVSGGVTRTHAVRIASNGTVTTTKLLDEAFPKPAFAFDQNNALWIAEGYKLQYFSLQSNGMPSSIPLEAAAHDEHPNLIAVDALINDQNGGMLVGSENNAVTSVSRFIPDTNSTIQSLSVNHGIVADEITVTIQNAVNTRYVQVGKEKIYDSCAQRAITACWFIEDVDKIVILMPNIAPGSTVDIKIVSGFGETPATATSKFTYDLDPSSGYQAVNAGSNPRDVVGGTQNDLWYIRDVNGEPHLTHMTSAGQITDMGVAPAAQKVVVAADGAAWYYDTVNSELVRTTAEGDRQVFATSATPFDIISDKNGVIWFSEPLADKIATINSNGTITEYTLPSGFAPISLANVGDEIWAFNLAGTELAKVAADGTVTTVATSQPVANVVGFVGTTDAGWFIKNGSSNVFKVDAAGQVTAIDVSTIGTKPSTIVQGVDGNIWVGFLDTRQIAKIAPDGTVTPFALPLTNSGDVVISLTNGPDDKLWISLAEHDILYGYGPLQRAPGNDTGTGTGGTPGGGSQAGNGPAGGRLAETGHNAGSWLVASSLLAVAGGFLCAAHARRWFKK